MDSFIGLFNPADSVIEPRKKQQKNRRKNVVITDIANNINQQSGSGINCPQNYTHYVKRGSPQKNAHLPDESSFLCEPDLDNEILVKNSSYIDSYMKEDDQKLGRIIKRRNFGRRNRKRRSKQSPIADPVGQIGPIQVPENLNNTHDAAKTVNKNFGKNVNDLNDDKRAKRNTEPFTLKQADGNLTSWCHFDSIDRLEKVSVTEFDLSVQASPYEYFLDDEYGSNDDSDSSWESGSEVCGRLPPEPQLGNVEYKLKLVRPSEQRFQHLVTQLKWRMISGGGTAVYVVGVDDDGAVRGLSPNSLRLSVRTLTLMARSIGATLQVTTRRTCGDRVIAEVVIRKMTECQESVELRVAVMGANEAGKSTLVGVLTQGELDNGRGSARLNMFRHLHEVRSGRTSSLSHEILGFDAQGGVVNYGCSELMTAARIDAKSSKLIAFIDLAGHYKYQRTTVFGLALYRPHYAMLVVSATAGINRMTEEHLSLALALDLQFFAVVTKVELVSESELDLLLQEIRLLLKKLTCDKELVLIQDEHAASELLSHEATQYVGVFPVSCVRGLGLGCLHAALHAATPHELACTQEPCEFQIDEIFCVGDNICPIVGGLQVKGCTYDGDTLLIGPLETGEFIPIQVKSIYRNRVPCTYVKSGQSASLGLSQHPPILRQGMVLIAVPNNYKPRLFKHNENCNGKLRTVSKQNKKKLLKKINNKRKNFDSDSDFKKDSCDSSSDTAKTDFNRNNARKRENESLTQQTEKEKSDFGVTKDQNNAVQENQDFDNIKSEKNDFDRVKSDKNDFDRIKNDKNDFSEDDFHSIKSDKNDTDIENHDLDSFKSDKIDFSVDTDTENHDFDSIRKTTKTARVKFQENLIEDDDLCIKSEKLRTKLDYNKNDDNLVDKQNGGGVETQNGGKVLQDDMNLYTKSDSENENMCFGCDCFTKELILDDKNDPRGCLYFQASVRVLPNSCSIYPGVQLRVYSGNIRQTAVVEGVMSRNNVICPGESAPAVLRFCKQPEFIRPDRRVLLRSSRETCAVGNVTQVFPYIEQ